MTSVHSDVLQQCPPRGTELLIALVRDHAWGHVAH
jgi:hypothetical protein